MGQVYLMDSPESGTLLVKWSETSDRQCRVNFNLTSLTTSLEMPVRQTTYSCGVEAYLLVTGTNRQRHRSSYRNADLALRGFVTL